jgi:hypothetical protein
MQQRDIDHASPRVPRDLLCPEGLGTPVEVHRIARAPAPVEQSAGRRKRGRGVRTRVRGAVVSMLAGALCLATADTVAEISFAPSDIMRWEPHSFAGTTDYRLVEIDGRQAVEASCTDSTASGLFHRRDIDLSRTPIVEWEWRVDETWTGIDETTRSGDDYAARVYLVEEAPLLRWRTRAMNYVWSSTREPGDDWPNAFASQARMIAVAGSQDAGQGWRTERRNVLEDFRRYHDREPGRINTVAVMTDCDNTRQRTRAWYGSIRFLPE